MTPITTSLILLGFALSSCVAAPLPGTPAGIRIPLSRRERSVHHSSKRQSEGLTFNPQDFWYGTVAIGTPPQNVNVLFDSGSSDLWVSAKPCSGNACGPDLFDPTQSSTLVTSNNVFGITYGDGSVTSGPICSDTVTVAGVTVTNQAFSPATQATGVGEADGILGLGFAANSNISATLGTKYPPFVNNALAQGTIKAGEYSFFFSETSGSELFIGGTDSARYTGTLESHPIVAATSTWQLDGATISVNGQAVDMGGAFQTLIDSGTALINGPADQVAKFYAAVQGATQDAGGNWMYPCSVNAGFSWGGATFPFSFSQGNSQTDSSMCVGGIQAGSDTFWILGDLFMKNVYSVFSFDAGTISFANLA